MLDWIKPHLVDDLSAIWKRWSVKILAAQVVIGATYLGMEAIHLAPTVPELVRMGFFVILSLAGLAASPFKQSNLPPQ